ncbi:MAG: hypothetical protein AAFV07_04160, partial [Bacteroidota bacterium]
MAQAQSPDTGLQLRYKRQNNFTYGARLGLGYGFKKDQYEAQLRLTHDHILNSARPDQPFVQLLVGLQFWQFYRLDPKWSIASWLESDQFWNSGNQRHSIYAGVRYEPSPHITLTPLIGYSFDLRTGILDQGISPGLIARIRQDYGDGFTMETEGMGRLKYISPRHQRNLLLRSTWTKQFDAQSILSLTLQGGANQMDNYRNSSVEQIKSDTVAGQLNITYPLMPGLIWQSNNQVLLTRRKFDYEALKGQAPEFNNLSFGQADLLTRQSVSLEAGKLRGSFVYMFQNLNRRYTLGNQLELVDRDYTRLLEREQQKDFIRRQTNLDLSLTYAPKDRHLFNLIGSNRYVQYDTPAEANFDDHDELNYGLSLEWRARWRPGFSTGYKLLGSVRRYAFLLGNRSQDNYTQRSLRMEFAYDWEVVPNLRLKGQQFIYVTYNVKDFEDRNFTDRSTRNLESRLEIAWRPSDKIDTEWSLYRKEWHVSYLNWEAFSETTLDTTVIYLLNETTHLPLFTQSKTRRYQLDVGYRQFSRLRYLNTSMLNLRNVLTPINLHIRYHQLGPVTGIRIVDRKA